MLGAFLSTHDIRFCLAAALASLLGTTLCWQVLPLPGARPTRAGVLRTAIAGVGLGATVWIAFRLSLAGYFPFLSADPPEPADAIPILLAITGATTAVAVIVFAAHSARTAVLAGSVLAATASCVLFLALSHVVAPLMLGYELATVLEAMVAGTAVFAFGLWRGKRARGRYRTLGAAAIVAVGLPVVDFGSLAAILPFSAWESASATLGALALRPVFVVFASEFVAALLLVRASAAVDRQAAARTTRENQRLRQLTESTFEGLVVHREGRIVDANGAFCALVQRRLPTLAAHHLSEFAPGFQAGAAGQPLRLELRAADGSMVPVEMLSRRLSLPEGEAVVTAVRDIRERLAAEHAALDRQRAEALQREADEQRERRRIAEEASRAKSAFLAMMSHEIRTPMNAVLGLASSLLDDGLTTEQAAAVTAIRDSGDTLLRILNDILDFSKLDAGRMTFETAPFSPAALMHDALSVHRPHAVAKALAIRLEIEPDLPATLLGDAGRIRQVLHNLVSNAVKFTDAGEVRMSLRCEWRDATTATLAWDVQDTGIGIAPDKLPTLFDAFVQADDSITRRFGGSGLGLAISQQLLAQMGGTIEVRSTPGEGSRFRFRLTLPLAEQAVQVVAPGHAAAEVAARLAALGRPLRLLLAEDNPTNQFVVIRMLKGLPVEVDVAQHGAEAVAAASRAAYDVICMDMRMPTMDGLEATRTIRRREGPSSRAPIVAMTANAFPEDMTACRDAGMNDFVAKPVSKDRLLAALLRAVEGATTQAARAATPIGQRDRLRHSEAIRHCEGHRDEAIPVMPAHEWPGADADAVASALRPLQ